ncbi:MAG: ABC transporter ATP-binding protein [Lachnospiraceae bacterium]|nr:ABC transporter ATP-binding protein [Lachnospiraceae bacterium]
MKLIYQYLRRHLGIFLLSMLFLTMEAMADLLQPTFMSYIVDDGVKQADIRRICVYGAMMLLIALIGAVSAVMRNYFASCTSQSVGRELRKDIYHNVAGLSLENIDRLHPASIITRITNDVTQIQEFINGIMRIMVKAPITCIGAIVLIILQTPGQLPVILGIVVISALLIAGNMKIGYPKFGAVQGALDKLNDTTRQFLASVRVVKAFRAEEQESRKFAETSGWLADANTSALRTMAIFSPLVNLTVNFGIVLLLWISQSSNSGGIGKLMASVNYMTQILFAASMISNALNTAVRAMASSKRIQEVLDEQPAQKQAENPKTPEITGDIALKDVSFSYAGAGNPSLQNINIHIHSGETIGMIGPTGSGKSTLVNLIPRFYDATKGSVELDNCSVCEIEQNYLRSAIAVVPQKALLFSGTIRENLLWGRSDAAEAEIENASRIACADEFIAKLPEGYDTMLGQGGVNLSGGQKQRLCLARALVRAPKILILDDCTSALDAQTEASVLNGLSQLKQKTTVLLISQRISTVMRCNHILCLDNGQMRGYGTHEDLMRSCETYQEIYKSQIGGGENE